MRNTIPCGQETESRLSRPLASTTVRLQEPEIFALGLRMSRLRVTALSIELVFVLLTVALPVAKAGTLTIVGTPILRASIDGGSIDLSGSFELRNQGNESAREVFPEVEIGSWSWVGTPEFMTQGSKKEWKFEELVSVEKLACRENVSFCTNLPARGALPVRIRRHYQDLNGYRFTSPDVLTLEIGALTSEEQKTVRIPSLDANLALGPPGQQFSGKLEISNLAEVRREVLVSAFSSRELNVEMRPEIVTVLPGNPVTLPVSITNFRGLDGSIYAVFAVLEWQEGAIRNSVHVSAGAAIARSSTTPNYIIIALIAGLTVAGMLYFFVIRPAK